MPFLNLPTATIHYEDTGAGEPVIAVHGLIENTAYWSETGITARLSEKYRFVSMDMRGHGQSIAKGIPPGYNAETIADDMEALADHLGFDRFHLLTHSTGGFAASRWAMDNSSRLAQELLSFLQDHPLHQCP